ncbi:MAG: hypothetical protein H6737_16515 [Alphaproteobacteria bacterium]|nr:hypothetical protein [Alphaproteobacteria bacterium]
MKAPTLPEWRLFALVTVLSWPMQLHAKHIPHADPLAIPGFAMLAYVAWPLASVALVFGSARRLAAGWLVAVGLLTLWMSNHGAWQAWKPELLAAGALATGSAALVFRHAGLTPRDFGLGPGEWRRWAPITVLGMGGAALLVWLGAALSPELVGFYPVYGPARHDTAALVGWELAMVVYMLCWEALWRGTMLFGARRSLSDAGAVALQALPFFVLHFTKPELEMAASIVGGLVLGAFCVWARSCWPAAILHATLYVSMEITGVAVRTWG